MVNFWHNLEKKNDNSEIIANWRLTLIGIMSYLKTTAESQLTSSQLFEKVKHLYA